MRILVNAAIIQNYRNRVFFVEIKAALMCLNMKREWNKIIRNFRIQTGKYVICFQNKLSSFDSQL